MTKRLITPPVALAVSLDAARRAARAPGSSLDAEIADKVRGITTAAEFETGRAFITQTWSVTLDHFPAAIELSRGAPLASVLWVKFFDINGVLQTLDPADYLVDSASEPGYVVPAPGRTWPATQARVNAIEVRYVCGYGDTDATVPADIKSYILGMVEDAYYPNAGARYLSRLLDGKMVYE